MRHAGLIHLRRDHPDIVGQLLGDLLDDADTRRVDPVIIGAKNAHAVCLLSLCPSADHRPAERVCLYAEGGLIKSPERLEGPAVATSKARNVRLLRQRARICSSASGIVRASSADAVCSRPMMDRI